MILTLESKVIIEGVKIPVLITYIVGKDMQSGLDVFAIKRIVKNHGVTITEKDMERFYAEMFEHYQDVKKELREINFSIN